MRPGWEVQPTDWSVRITARLSESGLLETTDVARGSVTWRVYVRSAYVQPIVLAALGTRATEDEAQEAAEMVGEVFGVSPNSVEVEP